MSNLETLVVGVGSPHGDDVAGWAILDHLEFDSTVGVELRKAKSPIDLLDWAGGIDRIIICDACRGAGPAGSIRYWSWPADVLEDMHFSGTHDFPLPAVLALADRLGRLPDEVSIWGLEIGPPTPGSGPSPEMRDGARKIADQLMLQLNQSSGIDHDGGCSHA